MHFETSLEPCCFRPCTPATSRLSKRSRGNRVCCDPIYFKVVASGANAAAGDELKGQSMSFRRLTVLVAALVAALDLLAGAGAQAQGLQAGQIFRDCSDCPEMVV